MVINNNSRILYILKLLKEYTDEQHPMSITDIVEYLDKQEIKAHRRTIMTDIESLKEFGIDIITIKSTQNKYFIGNRNFELPEVKLLIDAVESSKLITQKKSSELIRKLTALASRNQGTNRNRVGHPVRICNAECGWPVPHPAGRGLPGLSRPRRIAALRLLPRIAPWRQGAPCTTARQSPARG